MNRASWLRFAVALLVPIAFAACLSGKRISDIDAPGSPAASEGPPWKIPDGVVVPASRHGALEIDGLYPSIVPSDRTCCWVAPSATVTANEPPGATTLVVTLFVPEYPFFNAHPQDVTITAAGRSTRVASLAPGVHRVRIALPPDAAHAGPATIALHSAYPFVPAHEHVNADTRALGVILLGIAYQ